MRPLDTKSGSKGSLFGGTTGAALMASVSLAFHTAFSTSNISSTIYLFQLQLAFFALLVLASKICTLILLKLIII